MPEYEKYFSLRFTVFLLSITLTHMATLTGLMEGDMAVPKMLVDKTVQQSFLKNASALWSEGWVPYKFEKMELNGGVFEQIFRDEDMKLITDVLLDISQAVPCIEFRAVADSYVGNHILFTSLGDQERSANGCWSFVGNVGPQGGKAGQSLNLGRGCMEKEIVFHEVLHALG